MKVNLGDVHALPGLTPKPDVAFESRLDLALSGQLPVYFGAVPLALCVPSDLDYRPDLHPVGAAAIEKYGQLASAGRNQYLWVYQRGVWFVVADDYIPFFAALRGLPDYLPCMILGKPTGDMVKDVQGPLKHADVRRLLGLGVPDSGEKAAPVEPRDVAPGMMEPAPIPRGGPSAARRKIEHTMRMVGRARLADSYLSHVVRLGNGQPPRFGYDEFKRMVFDCEFDERGGKTPETAIIIHNAVNHVVGVVAEYLYLSDEFGERGKDWNLEMQALGESNERKWDMMIVRLADGSTTTRYFDITEFIGKH